jgi:hypothetical protein
MPKYAILTINDFPIKDSIYDIKRSLEESGICTVQRIYALTEPEGESSAKTKLVFIWVEWENTNAAWMFESAMNHNNGNKLIKLDYRYFQPICIKTDEYGNAIKYEGWIVKPSNLAAFKMAQLIYSEEEWSTYVAEGVSELLEEQGEPEDQGEGEQGEQEEQEDQEEEDQGEE